jgi:hypothetical protein
MKLADPGQAGGRQVVAYPVFVAVDQDDSPPPSATHGCGRDSIDPQEHRRQQAAASRRQYSRVQSGRDRKPAVHADEARTDGLAAVVALRRLADLVEAAQVASALRAGWSWSEVAEALGVTRQAVHKKLLDARLSVLGALPLGAAPP